MKIPLSDPAAVHIQVKVPVRVLRELQTVKLQSRLLKGQHHCNDKFLAEFFMKTAQEIMCAKIYLFLYGGHISNILN